MKILSFFVILFSNLVGIAQSPYTSIKVNMDSTSSSFISYKIEMKICEPKKGTAYKSFNSIDSSQINFINLKYDEVTCGNYFANGDGIEVLSGDKEYKKCNCFEFANQIHAWEKMFIFKISNRSSRAWWPEMYVVLPMKYKAFVTHIELTDLTFQSDKVIFLPDIKSISMNASSEIMIRQSLKDLKGTPVDEFPLKKILEEK